MVVVRQTYPRVLGNYVVVDTQYRLSIHPHPGYLKRFTEINLYSYLEHKNLNSYKFMAMTQLSPMSFLLNSGVNIIYFLVY